MSATNTYNLILITLTVLLVASVSALAIYINFDDNKIINPDRTTYNVPNWVKNNAYWWSQDMISDEEYAFTLEYLIDEGVIETKKCIGECIELG